MTRFSRMDNFNVHTWLAKDYSAAQWQFCKTFANVLWPWKVYLHERCNVAWDVAVIGWIGIVSVFLSTVQCHSDVSLIGGASNLVTDRPLDLPISERQGPGDGETGGKCVKPLTESESVCHRRCPLTKILWIKLSLIFLLLLPACGRGFVSIVTIE